MDKSANGEFDINAISQADLRKNVAFAGQSLRIFVASVKTTFATRTLMMMLLN